MTAALRRGWLLVLPKESCFPVRRTGKSPGKPCLLEVSSFVRAGDFLPRGGGVYSDFTQILKAVSSR